MWGDQKRSATSYNQFARKTLPKHQVKIKEKIVVAVYSTKILRKVNQINCILCLNDASNQKNR